MNKINPYLFVTVCISATCGLLELDLEKDVPTRLLGQKNI